MGLVPKVKELFCTGYINKIVFCPGSGIGMEIALYKGRSEVRQQCLYLAGRKKEDDENAEKRRRYPQPGKTADGVEKEAVGGVASGSQCQYWRNHGRGRIGHIDGGYGTWTRGHNEPYKPDAGHFPL